MTVGCLICGREFKALNGHPFIRHGVDARAYRERFGLNRTNPLSSPETSELKRKIAQSRSDIHRLTRDQWGQPGGRYARRDETRRAQSVAQGIVNSRRALRCPHEQLKSTCRPCRNSRARDNYRKRKTA